MGLFIEFLLLALGVYLYLFSRGLLKVKNPEMQERAEQFRKDNETWMRYGGMLLAAIMLMNIILHVGDLLG